MVEAPAGAAVLAANALLPVQALPRRPARPRRAVPRGGGRRHHREVGRRARVRAHPLRALRQPRRLGTRRDRAARRHDGARGQPGRGTARATCSTPPSRHERIRNRLHPAEPLAGATTVHLGLVDASGTLREKRLSAAAAERALRSGWSFIDAIDWWGPDDTVWRSGGSRSNRAIVDVESARPYPFGDDAAVLPGRLRTAAARPVAPCPRQDLVKRATASGSRRSGLGVRMPGPRAGQRFGDPGDGGQPLLVRADHGVRGRAPGGARRHAHARRHAGRPPLRRARSWLLRDRHRPRGARALGRLGRSWPSSTPRPTSPGEDRQPPSWRSSGPQFPGLGGHPSLSLRSTVDGAPVLMRDAGVLSKVGAPRSPACRRSCPSSSPWPRRTRTRTGASARQLGPDHGHWGVDNYSCALRVVADDPDVRRPRAPDSRADMSPHLCAGAVPRLRAVGHRGAARSSAPCRHPTTAAPGPMPALPRDLVEAAERLEPARRPATSSALPSSSTTPPPAGCEAEACHRFVSDEERPVTWPRSDGTAPRKKQRWHDAHSS